MAKFGLYSKNNLEECVTITENKRIDLAVIYFIGLKNLSIGEFDKLFVVKEEFDKLFLVKNFTYK